MTTTQTTRASATSITSPITGRLLQREMVPCGNHMGCDGCFEGEKPEIDKDMPEAERKALIRQYRTIKNPPAGHGPYYRIYKRNRKDHEPANGDPMEQPGKLKVGHVKRADEWMLADEFGPEYLNLTRIVPEQWTAQPSRTEQTERGGSRRK